MVARLGIGATVAAAIIFSILLVSNVLVFAASQDRQRLYSISDAEDSLEDSATALMGAGGANMLVEAQAAVSSGPLGCQTAKATAAAAVGGLSDIQQSGGTKVISTTSLAPDESAGDNLTMLVPFDGSIQGELDLSISMVASGASLGGEVSISKTEVHLVHLPVELDRLAGDCVEALDGMVQTLSAEYPSNCTSYAVGPLVMEAAQSAATLVDADGFAFGFVYAVVPGAGCGVSLQVWVQQTGIEGPGGTFTVKVGQGAIASFEQPTSARPGGISSRTGP